MVMDPATAAEIEQYLLTQRSKRLLRVVTCGSVDDGKSTLIGRLLYESKGIFKDQLATLERDSVKFGTQNGGLDFALLLDGLVAEREQGITIDVAYRFFATERRKFIVADTPGHEQYVRNMVTGASTADVAVVLVDARKGVLTDTRRHSYILSLLGVRSVVFAINKMDIVGYQESPFRVVEDECRTFAAEVGLDDVTAIPLSALQGDNILLSSPRMPWYHGSTLMGYLETVELDEDRMLREPFRLPVQWVNRPNLDYRGFAGTIASGEIRPNDPIVVQPSGRWSRVARIVTAGGDLMRAVAGQAVTLTLADEIDVSRGDVLAPAAAGAEVADQFETRIIWMDANPMLPGRSYLIKIGTKTLPGSITELKYRVDVNTLAHTAATQLEINEIGVCNLALEQSIPFDAYSENRVTGGFILIDRLTYATAGVGMLNFALRRAHNIHRQVLTVEKAQRAAKLGQRPCVIWLTGLSGAGKSTIANLVEISLHEMGRATYLLDGDNVRHGLNKDLGFTAADRVENVRRVAEVAKLMVDAGLIVIASFISPFRSERQLARDLLGKEEFVEVYVDAPLAVAEQRDPKGLYGKARRGELKNFTGIDSPYEQPENPELRLRTTECTPEDAANRVIERIRQLGALSG